MVQKLKNPKKPGFFPALYVKRIEGERLVEKIYRAEMEGNKGKVDQRV